MAVLVALASAGGADIRAKPANGRVELGIATHKGGGQGAELSAVQTNFGALGVFAQAILGALFASLGTLGASFNAGLVGWMSNRIHVDYCPFRSLRIAENN